MSVFLALQAVLPTEHRPSLLLGRPLTNTSVGEPMRSTLEQWERGLLCELWNRAELALLDDRPKTPQYALRMVDRELRKVRLEYRPSSTYFPSQQNCMPVPDYAEDIHGFAKRISSREPSKT